MIKIKFLFTDMNIKKRIISFLLVSIFSFELITPVIAMPLSKETHPQDWHFLFVICKRVDVDCDDGSGLITHSIYQMTNKEIHIIMENAMQFQEFMAQTGVMTPYINVIEIDTPIRSIKESKYGSWIDSNEIANILEDKINLNQYDHIFCVVNLNVGTRYYGITGGPMKNGTGTSCINFYNTQKNMNPIFPEAVYVHEFLHFMEQLNGRWTNRFYLHNIGDAYAPVNDEWKECYIDIILNQSKANIEYGTGVLPIVWENPPHILREIEKE